MSRLTAFLARWQEPAIWLPLLTLLALGAWVIAGALDRTATADAMAMLLHLPIRTAYAAAALGLAYLARRRQRRRLSDDEQADLWTRTLNGERGALTIYITDAVVWLAPLVLLLLFFWPA